MDDPDKSRPHWWKLISSIKQRSRILTWLSSGLVLLGFAVIYLSLKRGTPRAWVIAIGLFVALVFIAVTLFTITAISQDIHLDRKRKQAGKRNRRNS